jgi:hypothetical protein
VSPKQAALYAGAVFRGEPLPAGWPVDFAIVTACNPWGRVVSAEENQAADEALCAGLREAGYALHRLTGGSADPSGHQEPGWAVALDPGQALAWGRRQRQDAVFLVRAGRLSLLVCADGSEVDLGRPFQRLA